MIAARKDASQQGFWLGFFLGPLGIFMVFSLDNRPKCQHCRNRIDREASVCPYCQESLRDATDDILNARSKAELEEALEKHTQALNRDV